MRYKPQLNTIYIGRAHPVDMERTFEDLGRQLGLAVSLDALQSDWKSAGLKVEHSTDDGLDRYVVHFSPNAKTFWFDPATKRIIRTQGPTGTKVWTQYYRYNAPAVREIYDLGVPRNATIVDHRPTGELKDVLDRIDARVNEGFGDCVALMTATPLDSAGKPEPNTGTLTLFAQEGKKWMSHLFLVGESRVPTYRTGEELAPAIALPAGWPTPQVSPLIEPLSIAIPNDTYVCDGIKAWRVDFKPVAGAVGRLTDVGSDYGCGAHAKAWFSVPGEIWVGSERLFTFNPETDVKLKRDAVKRPGLIGILASDRFGSHEVWIDPKRDDLPVEYIYTRNDGPSTTMNAHWRFEAFAQVPGRRWHPTKWTHTITYNSTVTGVIATRVTLVHLQVEPRLRLDGKWYGNPIDRVGDKPIGYSKR
jgi:hypothetical protein